MCDLDCFHFSPVTTSPRSVKIATTHSPRVTTTADPFIYRSVKTTTTRPLVTSTTRPLLTTTTKRAPPTRSSQPTLSTTSSTFPDRNKTTRSGTKPTVHSFWSEWSPTNDLEVEVLTVPTTNSINPATNHPTQSSNSSKIVMAPWLQEILNEAIASNNISTTTQRSFERLVQFGDGFNNVDNENNGER